MYHYGLCELHNRYLHGGEQDHGHYLFIYEGRHLQDEFMYSTMEWMNEEYQGLNASHPTIRNYYQITHSSNYIKPEIFQIYVLETLETVTIIKTVWIRIFQRKFRKYIAKRLADMKNINNILHKRLVGR